ncbi:hypothetical protein PVAND_009842 [Polypedilum vanderplanki]|uniref:Lipase domain-containing protein n=1 Tax=Polypedilum vanderplanki TaxID=319348 RepID=A0A9J6CEX7_POLVA|nr:hypothetical protein PVAND_009842 [Polypedilum vanderplanki]
MNYHIRFILLIAIAFFVNGQQNETTNQGDTIFIGPCAWVLSNRKCPDPDIKFYLHTRSNPDDRQLIHTDETWEKSNLSSSFYNPRYPVKVIIHGYNSDMMLTPLIDAKREYLQRGDYNLFFVDWAVLGPAPCYPSAVHNTRHVGECIAQLISRIRDTGNEDIHLVGFSLGAQVCNYVATTLRNDNYTIPRITGLDPAMPLFITTDLDNKLDASDAEFVDVVHTNALVQGQIERCGHVDFYLNGGIIQPGCSSFGVNPFQCSHHRAPDYFAESIQSTIGFWGWKCQSYFYYLFGMCTPTSDMQALAGEDCRKTTQGMYFINTNAVSPFAMGRITDSSTKSQQQPPQISINSIPHVDPFQSSIDILGKLEGNFNNLPYSTNNYDESQFFINHGSDRITHNFLSRLRHQNMNEQIKHKRPNSRQSRDDDNNHITFNKIVHE